MRRTLLFYVAAMILYAFKMPMQFAYNYVLDSTVQSVEARIEFDNKEGESILQNSPAAFAGLLVIALVAGLSNIRRINIEKIEALFVFLLAIALPVVIHNVSGSVLYWFLVGLSFARFKNNGVSRPVPSGALR